MNLDRLAFVGFIGICAIAFLALAVHFAEILHGIIYHLKGSTVKRSLEKKDAGAEK